VTGPGPYDRGVRGVLLLIAVLIVALSVGGFVVRPAGEATMFSVSLCIAGFFGGLPVWAGHRTRRRALREAGMLEDEPRGREVTVER
jgi:hypothetical protein